MEPHYRLITKHVVTLPMTYLLLYFFFIRRWSRWTSSCSVWTRPKTESCGWKIIKPERSDPWTWKYELSIVGESRPSTDSILESVLLDLPLARARVTGDRPARCCSGRRGRLWGVNLSWHVSVCAAWRRADVAGVPNDPRPTRTSHTCKCCRASPCAVV